ncbi:MAG: hypothetical protein SCK28_13160 [Bacillota bacterium]|nr:hypothetical protein [Bacillota bacterium]
MCASHILELAQGIDHRAVVPNEAAKSIGNEITFAKDYSDKVQLGQVLLKLAEKVGRRLRKNNLTGSTISLKLKYSNFSQITRSITVSTPTDIDSEIFKYSKELLDSEALKMPVRLIGVTVSNFKNTDKAMEQLALFSQEPLLEEGKEKSIRLHKVLDTIKDKHGEAIIGRGQLAVGNFFKKNSSK